VERRRFYVTTPIYYINSKPHIGSAYTTVVADVLSRFHKIYGDEVFFLTGTDEHGQKVYKAAVEKGYGEDVKKYCDEMANTFKSAWDKLNIEYDRFIRTTDPDHEEVVKWFLDELYKKGDIYKGIYKGYYCVSCEQFVPEAEETNYTCPDCGKKLEYVEEENYFFKLSKYAPLVKKHIEENPEFIQPEFRRNEILARLEGEVKDVSITRATVKWGVECPFDPAQKVYVWFDALINYVSGIGFLHDEDKFKKFWPANVHLIGKDIMWFHCVIWPAMLMAAGIELPRAVFAHGWWKVSGEKMSKSKGNVVDPFEMVEKYGIDPLRFYLVKEIPLGLDGNFSEKALVERFNADVIDNWANLLNRTLAQIEKFFDGKIPEYKEDNCELKGRVEGKLREVEDLYYNYRLKEAMDKLNEVSIEGNKFITEKEPWKLAKSGAKEEAASVLAQVLELVRIVGCYYWPVIPLLVEKAFAYMDLTRDEALTLDWVWPQSGRISKREGVLHNKLEYKEE